MSYNTQNVLQQGQDGEYTVQYQPRKYHRDPPSPGDVPQGTFLATNVGGPYQDGRNVDPRFPVQDMSSLMSGQAPYPVFGVSQMPLHGRTASAGYHQQHFHGFGMDGFLPALNDTQGVYTNQPSPGSEGEDSDEIFSSPIPPVQFPPHEDTEAYLRQNLNILPPRPVNLSALPDEPFSGKAPKITDLIKLAIWGSKHKQLTLNQIYAEIENRYPSWKTAKDKPWQRSIRHNLSLKAIFVHQERPVSHPGKGHYWMLDYRQGEGNKRDRKRMLSSSRQGGMSDESDSEYLAPSNRHYGGPSVTNHPAPLAPLGMPKPVPGPGAFYHTGGEIGVVPSTVDLVHPLVHSDLRPGPPPSVGPNMRWDAPSSYATHSAYMAQSPSNYDGFPPMAEQHARSHPSSGNPHPIAPSYAPVPSRLAYTTTPSRPRRSHSDTFPEQDATENPREPRRHRTQ